MQRLKLNNDELMALANAMASKFDQSLETGTLNDALTQHEQTVAQIAPAIQAQQAEPTPAQALRRFTDSVINQITNMQKKHDALVEVLPIAVIASIVDQYVIAGIPKARVYELVDSLYDTQDSN